MIDVHDIVTGYLDAVYGGDAITTRRYLADRFSFIGPSVEFSDPDRYLRATEHATRAVRKLVKHKVFVDGQDACIFYDLHIDHAVGVIAVAEWYRVDGDRISAIRSILDTAPFASKGGTGTEIAVDPVCGMAVDQSSPSATRTYRSQTYYFCCGACAETFERQPERFLQAS
jgi:YHS domain-containing protein